MKKQKDLVLINPETGVQENCGTIIEKRMVGDKTLWLTCDYDDVWWIIIDDLQLIKLGYLNARREECWRLFFALDETAIASLKPS